MCNVTNTLIKLRFLKRIYETIPILLLAIKLKVFRLSREIAGLHEFKSLQQYFDPNAQSSF